MWRTATFPAGRCWAVDMGEVLGRLNGTPGCDPLDRAGWRLDRDGREEEAELRASWC